MQKIKYVVAFLLFASSNVNALDLDKDTLFQGITEQTRDFSCGAAALSTLITGLVENSNVSEANVMKVITEKKSEKIEGNYTASELAEASKNLGYKAEWREVSPEFLIKLKQPVMLLIGLNSGFPHYVVFKGIENGDAFLADPIRGNIRLSYEKLVKEGMSDKYTKWFAMAIEPTATKPKNSTLYLSNNKYDSHFTVEQSNGITLATVAKKNQLMISYDFLTSLGSFPTSGADLKSRSFNQGINFRYGITENVELGGNFSYMDSRQKMKFRNHLSVFNSENRMYQIYVNNKFSLNDSNGLIAGGFGSFSEYASIWGGGATVRGYSNTTFAQFVVGGSINKTFSSNNFVSGNLPNFQVSGYVSANKPIGDRYLGSVSFSVNDAFSKSLSTRVFNTSYTISPSVTYVMSKSFQMSPLFNYSFGSGDAISFGISLAYVGSW